MKTQEAQDTELQKSKVYKAALCERTSISERVRILGETACSVLARKRRKLYFFLLQGRHAGMFFCRRDMRGCSVDARIFWIHESCLESLTAICRTVAVFHQ